MVVQLQDTIYLYNSKHTLNLKPLVSSGGFFFSGRRTMSKTMTNKSSLNTITALQERLKRSDKYIAELLGYKAGSVLTNWRKNKVAPVTAGLAAECLLVRTSKGRPLPGDTRVIVLKGSNEDINWIISVADKIGIDFKEV